MHHPTPRWSLKETRGSLLRSLARFGVDRLRQLEVGDDIVAELGGQPGILRRVCRRQRFTRWDRRGNNLRFHAWRTSCRYLSKTYVL